MHRKRPSIASNFSRTYSWKVKNLKIIKYLKRIGLDWMQKNRNSLHDSPLRAIHYPTPGDNSLPKHLIQSDMSRVWPQLRFLKILTHFFCKTISKYLFLYVKGNSNFVLENQLTSPPKDRHFLFCPTLFTASISFFGPFSEPNNFWH